MGISLGKIAATSVALMGAGSVLVESVQVGCNNAQKTAASALTDSFISDTISASKLNYESEKHSATKNFLRNTRMFDGFTKMYNGVGGFFAGFFDTAARNIPTLGFSALTLLAGKHKGLKIAGAIATGVSMLADFLANGTSIFEKNDYLKR